MNIEDYKKYLFIKYMLLKRKITKENRDIVSPDNISIYYINTKKIILEYGPYTTYYNNKFLYLSYKLDGYSKGKRNVAYVISSYYFSGRQGLYHEVKSYSYYINGKNIQDKYKEKRYIFL